MARQPRHLTDREWVDQVEIIYGDPHPLKVIPALTGGCGVLPDSLFRAGAAWNPWTN